jgi:hypothetical protein
MKKLALVAVAALALSSLTGCQLCFLPCYVCGILNGGSVAAQDTKELPAAEIAPSFVSNSGLLSDRGAVAVNH